MERVVVRESFQTAGSPGRRMRILCESAEFSRLFFLLRRREMKLLTTLAVACGLMTALIANAAPDADAAQALMKKSDCFKCHAVDKKKDGPSFKETAKKYKGKADAETTLVKHITTSPMIEVDGKKEEHKSIKSKDAGEIKNVVQWILSL
jgi:cytochrome c